MEDFTPVAVVQPTQELEEEELERQTQRDRREGGSERERGVIIHKVKVNQGFSGPERLLKNTDLNKPMGEQQLVHITFTLCMCMQLPQSSRYCFRSLSWEREQRTEKKNRTRRKTARKKERKKERKKTEEMQLD